MHSPETTEEVELDLAAGALSHRAIARRLSVSRGFVDGLARGEVPSSSDRYKMRKAHPDTPRERLPGPVERCPGCGGLVSMPCCACLVPRALRAAGLSLKFGGPDEPIGVELHEEHRGRYADLHAMKRAADPAAQSELATVPPTSDEDVCSGDVPVLEEVWDTDTPEEDLAELAGVES